MIEVKTEDQTSLIQSRRPRLDPNPIIIHGLIPCNGLDWQSIASTDLESSVDELEGEDPNGLPFQHLYKHMA